MRAFLLVLRVVPRALALRAFFCAVDKLESVRFVRGTLRCLFLLLDCEIIFAADVSCVLTGFSSLTLFRRECSD